VGVISRHPGHPALASEADLIAAQDAASPGPAAGPVCAVTSATASKTRFGRQVPGHLARIHFIRCAV
jgi:hypothetical protein